VTPCDQLRALIADVLRAQATCVHVPVVTVTQPARCVDCVADDVLALFPQVNEERWVWEAMTAAGEVSFHLQRDDVPHTYTRLVARTAAAPVEPPKPRPILNVNLPTEEDPR
jgi:hypothetical protein